MKKQTIPVILVAVICFLFAIWVVPCNAADTEYIYGCENKSGAISIVSDLSICKGNVNPVTWNAGATGPQGAGLAKVYDASDQFLGYFQTIGDGYMRIYLPSLKKIVNFDIYGGNLVGFNGILFESSDCTGQQYSDSTTMYYVHQWAGKNYTGKIMAPISVSIKSLLYNDGSCIIPDNPFQMSVVEQMEITTLPFSAPVALPMRLE